MISQKQREEEVEEIESLMYMWLKEKLYVNAEEKKGPHNLWIKLLILIEKK